LLDELDCEDSTPSPLVVAEMEQALLVAFVTGHRHNYTHLLNGDPSELAPRQIRLVEDYISANWNQPISIDALAAVANASARSIFKSFKIHRGYTPMQFAKDLRARS
jgi:transcriptional regulator GlxA family with amidase domain